MMSRDWSYYASQIASGLFHPLLMPWYGVFMLFCAIFDTGDAYRVLMAQYLRVTILETVVWTLVVPVVLLFVLLLIGRISSLQMPERKERALPYFVCSLCYVVWCGRLWVAQVPVEWLLTAMGGTMTLAVVAAVNMRWKISAHSAGIGGLMGSVLGYAVTTGLYSWGVLLCLTGITLWVMAARIRLKGHTPEQVSAGWLTGLLCTLLPVYIYTITS